MQVSLEAVPSQIDPKQLWSFTPAFPSGAYFISSVADNELFASHPPDASTKLPVVISKIPVLVSLSLCPSSKLTTPICSGTSSISKMGFTLSLSTTAPLLLNTILSLLS